MILYSNFEGSRIGSLCDGGQSIRGLVVETANSQMLPSVPVFDFVE